MLSWEAAADKRDCPPGGRRSTSTRTYRHSTDRGAAPHFRGDTPSDAEANRLNGFLSRTQEDLLKPPLT
jgi:hypothetical protein